MKALRPAQIWGMPILVGTASLLGLAVALIADGLGDAIGWLALGVPVTVGWWYGLGPGRRTG